MSVDELRNIEDQLNKIKFDISPDYFNAVDYKLLDTTFFESLDNFNSKLKKVSHNKDIFYSSVES